MKDDKQINLQTPYEIKSPACTKKHLNTNITDTGKGNHRRWQATGGQREQRANSAGRFRHGSPRSYTSRVNPSTSLQNAVKNKVYRLHRKTPEYQHYRYRQGQLSALASHRRTARNERIPPDGFDTTALEATLHRRTSPPFFMDGIHGKLGFHLPQQQNYNQPQQTKSQQ